MNRSSQLALALISALTVYLTSSHTTAAKESRSQSSAKLNVVFILADDLGWGELGCYGQQKIPTPNIDKLATEGMRFTQHYSGAPVCAPSRCVLMTGKHLGHAEIRGNQQAKKTDPKFTEGQHPISADVITMATAFRNAGYKTGAMGKWGLGPVGSTGDPNNKGFDLFFGYNCQAVAHSYYPPHIWRNDQQIVINKKPIPGHKKQPEGEVRMADWIGETYAPSMMIAEAEKFIESNRENSFFLYLPFIEPHVAMHPPVSSVEKFPKEWDSKEYRGEAAYLPHPRPHAAYAAMISDLDGYVGRVLDKLDQFGLNDNTLVIFTSDNGTTHEGNANTEFHIGGADAKFFNSTADLRGYKGSVYEGGIRVPMIARLPGVIPAGTTSSFPCYFADWFPTMCDAVGLKKQNDFDGESFWSVLKGEQRTERSTPMVWIFPEYGGQFAVRMGDYKAVRQGIKSRDPGNWELYNIEKDRGEQHDLAASQSQLLEQAIDILAKEWAENKVFPMPVPTP